MKLARIIVGALALVAAAVTQAEPAFVGDYRLAAGPDVVGALTLMPDGRFRYALSAGALDEHAQGRWLVTDGQVRLYTEPRPNPPLFSAGPQAVTKDAPFKLLVTWPNGKGIAGVDFTIGFDSGAPVTGYTQEYGWTLPGDEDRIPLWVELAEPIHGIASPRFAIDVSAGNAVSFVLTPNDLGIADFNGTVLQPNGDRLIMQQRLGALAFVRSVPR